MISSVVLAFLASAGWKDAWEMPGPGRVEEAGDENLGGVVQASDSQFTAFSWPRLPALRTAVLDLETVLMYCKAQMLCVCALVLNGSTSSLSQLV